jgi:hypothetical protein
VLGHRIVALGLVRNESSSRLQVHATFHRVIAGLPSYDVPGTSISTRTTRPPSPSFVCAARSISRAQSRCTGATPTIPTITISNGLY